MKLSLKMLAEKLEKHVAILRFKDIYSTLRLGRPVFLTDETVLLKNTLYITSGNRIPENLSFEEGCGLIIAGDQSVNVLNMPAVILTDDSTDIFTLYNHIAGIFDFFNTWHNQLEYISAHYGRITAFEKFISSSSAVFENMLAISDSSFNYITSSKAENADKSAFSFDRLSDEVLSILRNNPANRMLDSEKEIFVASDPDFPHRVMIRNIFHGTNVIYRITVSETDRVFRETDYLFLEFLASYVEKLLRRDYDIPASGAGTLSDILYNALITGTWNKPALEKEFGNVRWSPEDSFTAIYLPMKKQSLILDSISFYCKELVKDFAGVIALNYHGNIVLVINHKLYRSSDEGAVSPDDVDFSELLSFLKDNALSAGASNTFSNIYELKKYYRQAETAYEIGSVLEPEKAFFSFSEYTLAYIFKAATAEFTSDDLLSPVYRRLADHDRENNTEYLKTLKEYLVQNMNAVQTASSLYIHRATLIYRMKRICEIGQTELKEPGELLHLALSFGLDSDILKS